MKNQMFIYQKRICECVRTGERELTVNMLTVRTPSMMIPGGSLLVGELLPEEGVRTLGIWNSLSTEQAPEVEKHLRQVLQVIQTSGEEQSESKVFPPYFTGGGWWIDVVCFSADDVTSSLLEDKGYATFN